MYKFGQENPVRKEHFILLVYIGRATRENPFIEKMPQNQIPNSSKHYYIKIIKTKLLSHEGSFP